MGRAVTSHLFFKTRNLLLDGALEREKRIGATAIDQRKMEREKRLEVVDGRE